jgi:hypothetical protein
MVNLFLAVLALIKVDGIWEIPSKPANLILAMQENNGKVIMALGVPNGTMTTITSFYGDIIRSGKTTSLVMKTDKREFNKCKLSFTITATGYLSEKEYKTKAILTSYIECGDKIKKATDDISGIWKFINPLPKP